MSGKLPEVRCGLFINATFAEEEQSGFEMKLDVTYRNLPPSGLIALEKETAALIDRMASYGETQQVTQ